MPVTRKHLREALEICKRGGTPEHPYDQSSWGNNVCGTACCLYGHACLLAGEPVRTPTEEWRRDNGVPMLSLMDANETIAIKLAEKFFDDVDPSDADVLRATQEAFGGLTQTVIRKFVLDARWSQARINEAITAVEAEDAGRVAT